MFKFTKLSAILKIVRGIQKAGSLLPNVIPELQSSEMVA